jgi:hypothetical protein
MFFAAVHESAFGPKRTSLVAPHMSAFGGKADIALGSSPLAFDPSGRPLFTLGYSLHSYINTVTLLASNVTV